jgi:hypothetical protein
MRRTSLPSLLVLTLVLAACGPSSRGNNGRVDGGNDTIDASDPGTPDAHVNPFGDADIIGDGGLCGDNACANPVDDLCGDTELCNNGLDDDCDGDVEEGCACQAGSVQPCFRGQPGRRNVGACQDGTQRCEGDGEFAQWGDCTGGISPRGEACDSQDNNCNGCADDHPDCCDVTLNCPGPGDMPEAQPFAPYVINGTMFYAGPVQSWSWTVVGGPCDVLLAPSRSFTLAGQTSSNLTFTPTLSGDYTVRVVMTLPDGSTQECEFIVHVGGPGLRVEACWDTDGMVDIDLHVHRPDSTTPWLCSDTTCSNFNTDDCNFANCTSSAWSFFGTPADWGYPQSPLAECEDADSGWSLVGFCANPRLDIDNIFTVGKPENINIDRPENGKAYRVALHYYGGSLETHPLVNVYCGGKLLGTYGAAPDTITGFGSGDPESNANGPWWRVVDVTPTVDGMGVTTDCALTPLNPPGQTTGHWITCPRGATGPTCFDTSF